MQKVKSNPFGCSSLEMSLHVAGLPVFGLGRKGLWRKEVWLGDGAAVVVVDGLVGWTNFRCREFHNGFVRGQDHLTWKPKTNNGITTKLFLFRCDWLPKCLSFL